MKILVTGGLGYIGSHTVVELLGSGCQVAIADNLSNSEMKVLNNIEKITGIRPDFYQLELCDKDGVRRFFRELGKIDGIIHFAAKKSVFESVQKPILYYENNLRSLLNILECMIAFGVKDIVFSSSCTVYGQPDTLPVTEDSPRKKAESPYGNTKKISEDIISDTVRIAPVKAISLRYFNPIGAHESALIGELPLKVPDNLIPYLTQTAIGIRPFLRVFGDDYDTPDGTPIRDYIHVVDIAKAHVIALARMKEAMMKSGHEVFNLGTGQGYSVLEVIQSFERSTGVKLRYKILDRRPGDIEKVWADTRLANRELGWKAEKSLDEMTSSAWKWQKRIGRKMAEQ